MIFLIPLLLRAGIPSRFGKAAAWLVTGLLVLVLIVGGVLVLRSIARSHDAAVANEAASDISRDLTIEAAARVINAGEAATVNQMARDDVAANNTKEIDREVAKGDASAVGPGVSGVLTRMRDQQAAGRR